MFLAVFSVAVAVGSGLAAWLSAGRIVILPTLIGAVGLGVFAIDLGWATYARAARPAHATPCRPASARCSDRAAACA